MKRLGSIVFFFMSMSKNVYSLKDRNTKRFGPKCSSQLFF